MAAKKPAKKEFTEPLVVRNPSEPFYKAFMFDSDNPDMIVDVSGDSFSYSIPDAIIALFETMPQDFMMKIPDRNMWISDDAVEYDHDATSPYLSQLLILQLRANYNQQLVDAITDRGEHEFHVRIKDLTEGYVSAIQDYNITALHLEAKNTTDKFHLRSISLAVSDAERANPIFPETLTVGSL